VSYFAYVPNIVDGKGVVEQVIRIDQETLETGQWGNPFDWIQTSYNTIGNKHTLGGTPLRGNFAGIGYSYDAQADIFIPPQPFASWVLNEDTCLWESPVPYPNDGERYAWNEETQQWVVIEEETE
jgi:hypothetical protein